MRSTRCKKGKKLKKILRQTLFRSESAAHFLRYVKREIQVQIVLPDYDYFEGEFFYVFYQKFTKPAKKIVIKV